MGNLQAKFRAWWYGKRDEWEELMDIAGSNPRAKVEGADFPFKGQNFGKHFALSEEQLGDGGYAVVRLGTHVKTGKQYAVKCIQKARLPDADVGMLQNEIEIMKSLQHPNIVRLYSWFADPKDDCFRLVMEVLEGGELFDRIVARQRYTECDARDLLRILLETMAFMHRRHIVHRDLKPENLLMLDKTNDYHIKVADFGFAADVSGRRCKDMVGTPNYVAPEVIRMIPYGTEADMWGVGVIFFILLAGYQPFNHRDQARLYQNIKRGRYSFDQAHWGEISSPAKHLISMMLTVDPRDRITARAALRHPWFATRGDTMKAAHLETSLRKMQIFNARRKFRGAVHTIVATDKLHTWTSPSRTDRKSSQTRSSSMVD